ncbi:MAG: hypothetical protein GC154_10465 [bacterium]|nr:hypothetical protein [bacterium]
MKSTRRLFLANMAAGFAVFACGGKKGYLSDAERNRTELALERCRAMKSRLAEPDKWVAQTALKTLDDARAAIEENVAKMPEGRQQAMRTSVVEWKKRVLRVTMMGAPKESKPYFDALNDANEQSIQLLSQFIDSDQ